MKQGARKDMDKNVNLNQPLFVVSFGPKVAIVNRELLITCNDLGNV
jgi:hypothetical protein